MYIQFYLILVIAIAMILLYYLNVNANPGLLSILNKPPLIISVQKTGAFLDDEIISSRPFGRQELKDPTVDWIDLETGNLTYATEHRMGPEYTDIVSVDYLSDGKFLNATLWLASLDGLSSPSSSGIYYGMAIDSDLNNNTGFRGIEYQSQVSYGNATNNTWIGELNELSINNEVKSISPIKSDRDFFEMGKNYITLSADLEPMLFPDKFKVFFYAYSHEKDGSWLLDAVRWAYIPPPEFTISTSPKTVFVKIGEPEPQPVEMRLNSSTDLETTVDFSASNVPAGLNLNFSDGISESRVPSFGMISSPLSIDATDKAHLGPHTLLMKADISFPDTTFDSPILNPRTHKSPKLKIQSEDIKAQMPFLVSISPASPQDPLGDFGKAWDNLGGAINVVGGIVIGVSLPFITKRLNKDKRVTHACKKLPRHVKRKLKRRRGNQAA
jgi:hypothetical protein